MPPETIRPLYGGVRCFYCGKQVHLPKNVGPWQPLTAHGGVPDPASAEGTPEQIEKAFRDALIMLDEGIILFLNLPLASVDKLAIKKEIDGIGHL